MYPCFISGFRYENLRDRPHERPIFQGFCVSPRRQRSWQHCRQLGDLLRVAGGIGSDATAEAVDGRAKAEGMWKCRRVKIFTNYRSACAARNLASENLRDRPRERHILQGVRASRRRRRSRQHCQQLGDPLRAAGSETFGDEHPRKPHFIFQLSAILRFCRLSTIF